MTDELFSLRVIVVSGSRGDHDLFRQAASASKVPIEIIEADGAGSACRCLADAVDLVFLDAALAGNEIAQVAAAARRIANPPFTVLLSAPGAAAPFETDALAAKPSHLEEAKRLMESSIRVRLTSRVLVLDDSPSLRRAAVEELASIYAKAVKEAREDTGLAPNAFPKTCPYSLTDLLESRIVPE